METTVELLSPSSSFPEGLNFTLKGTVHSTVLILGSNFSIYTDSPSNMLPSKFLNLSFSNNLICTLPQPSLIFILERNLNLVITNNPNFIISILNIVFWPKPLISLIYFCNYSNSKSYPTPDELTSVLLSFISLKFSFFSLFSINSLLIHWGFPGGSIVKNLPAMQETQIWSLGQEDPLEKGMETHSSIFACRIP